MKTTIDAAGRLVIPSEIRRAAKLSAGATLDVQWRDGRIEIEPVAEPVSIHRRGQLWVAEPKQPLPALTNAEVEQTCAALRDERAPAK
jgi:AbrB family looped-hinge helix DNA binding protein